MAVSMQGHMMVALSQLRFQATAKRVRVRLDGAEVADTVRAVLIWEPMRVVPSYAVPEADIAASLGPAPSGETPDYRPIAFGSDSPPLLDPSVPFGVHTADGEPLTVSTGTGRREASGYRLHDEDLQGYVVLDFDSFAWWEEDERLVGHPRDPFHRIDVRPSSRSVRIEHGGHVLAESTRCRLLFEGAFPMARYYLPREDVRVSLVPGTRHTTCAYKGHASHYTAHVGDDGLGDLSGLPELPDLPDIAWSYEEPLEDALRVQGLVCFYHERLDLFVDGVPVERVRTPWS